jgi:hypothetical protein
MKWPELVMMVESISMKSIVRRKRFDLSVVKKGVDR